MIKNVHYYLIKTVYFYLVIYSKEFDRIGKEYPKDLDADRETAEIFRKKYVDGHKILAEGWNVILPAETETV